MPKTSPESMVGIHMNLKTPAGSRDKMNGSKLSKAEAKSKGISKPESRTESRAVCLKGKGVLK